jgi:hypothetical protein
MITEELLERGLGTAGDAYDIPPAAVDDILGELRPREVADDEVAANPAIAHRWRPSRRAWVVGTAAAVIVLVVVAFAVGGSGGTGASHTTATGAESKVAGTSNSAGSRAGANFSGGAPAAPPVAGIPQAATFLPSGAGSSGGSVAGQSTARTPSVVPNDSLTKIAKTGQLDLQVDKSAVKSTVVKLSGIARALGGIAADSQLVEGSDATGSVTLRVPASAFDDAVRQSQALGKVLSSQTKAADVTSQYVDLQARLKSLAATRSTFLQILTKASTIGEILSVQQRINDVQTQIEQLQGQFKVLTEQTTFATLTVTVDQKPKAATVAHSQSGIGKAIDRSVSRFVHGVEALIGVIGPIVLVLLLLGLGWVLARVGYRIVRRQMV